MSFYQLIHTSILLYILTCLSIAQKNCTHLQNGDPFLSTDTVLFSQSCTLNTTTAIHLNNIHLTIDGQNNIFDFSTNQTYLFEITNNSILTIQNLEIQSPFKHTSDLNDLISIFHLSNNAQLILDNVQFTNAIADSNDYHYTQYIIYSPQNTLASSIHIHHTTFDTDFAVRNSTVYMIGTPTAKECTAQINVTNTVYNQGSQPFIEAFCSDISIIDSNITNNIIAENDCLLCLGYNTQTTVNNTIFDGNNGVLIYTQYTMQRRRESLDDMLTLTMQNNVITNHINTAITMRSNTIYPSFVHISDMTVIDSAFNTNGFLQLYPNLNSNIRMEHSYFYNNSGVMIASDESTSDNIDTNMYFMSCLDAYDTLQMQENGIWIADTAFDLNRDMMFDIKYQRLALIQVNLTNNVWTTDSLFDIHQSSLYVSDAYINANTDNGFEDVFKFNDSNSLCFDPSFMTYAFAKDVNDFSINDLFAFTNTLTEVKGVGISHIELNNCDSTQTVLDPLSVEYIKFSHFNATNCPILSTDVNRDADNGVSIDFYNGIFVNSSILLYLHTNDRIRMTNCKFYDTFIELSSAVISNTLADNSKYGILDTNVMIDYCVFEGLIENAHSKLLQINANDEWLPSITFKDTQFIDISTNNDNNSLITISTNDINVTGTLPYSQSAIQFIDCTFEDINEHIFTITDDAIYDYDAQIATLYFSQCTFKSINSTIVYHSFQKQAAIKFDFEENEFKNINTTKYTHAMLHFTGFDCNHTYSRLLDNDVSFSKDTFEGIKTYQSLIYASCINLALTKVSMVNNKGYIAYGISLTKSEVTLSSVTMSGNSDSIYGGIYCFAQMNDVSTCNMQIINSVFSGNQAQFGGVISFDTAIATDTITDYASIQMYYSNFTSNTATQAGGAIYINDMKGTPELFQFNDINFENNHANVGGAVYIKETALNCKNCQFIDNIAVQYGGAMVMISDICTMNAYSNLTLYGGTNVSGNTAAFGGGLALICYDLYTNNVMYANNGIESNITQSSVRGGAIFAHKTCMKSIVNNSFMHNSAEYGGGIAISAPVKCMNDVTQNMFVENIGSAVLLTTSWIDVYQYNIPINNEFNITFDELWFGVNSTDWVFDIYNNTFESNRGDIHGGAILISPNDFIDEIIANVTTNMTNNTLEESSLSIVGAVNKYEINIFDNRFIANEIGDNSIEISDNAHGGGAIAWLLDYKSSSRVNIYECDFVGNSGNNGQGGAIWVNCYDCSFREETFLYYTAAFNISRENSCEYCSYETYMTNDVYLSISDLYFYDNMAATGGAMAVSCIGNLNMNNIAFMQHTRTSFYGGSVYLHQLSNVWIDNITIDNTSTDTDKLEYIDSKGGGIYGSCITDDLVLSNSVVSNGMSVIGGGIFLYETPNITITQSKFTLNQAVLAGGCISIFTPGQNDRTITINNVNFTENIGAALGSTIYIGSYRDIILMFNGYSPYLSRDTDYPPTFDVWDIEDFIDREIDKRKITQSTEKLFTFENKKYSDNILSVSRIIVDFNLQTNNTGLFRGTPQWSDTDGLLYDAAGTLTATIDKQRSFGNVIFLTDINGIYEGMEYTFLFDGGNWLDALNKDMIKNITFKYDMIALLENEWYDDNGSITVDIEQCSFIGNEMGTYEDENDMIHYNGDAVIGNVYIDDPYGIAAVSSMDNQFMANGAKVGASLVHLSGYSNDSNPIDLGRNNQDSIINCAFSDNKAIDTGNVVIHNADLVFIDSICSRNKAGLDGNCIATYSSLLEIDNVIIESCISHVSGAVYTDLSIVRITDTNFTNNTATFGDGSCVYSKRMIPIVLGKCPSFTFAQFRGEYESDYLFSVDNCLFDDNRAYDGSGGAIYIGTDYDKEFLSDNQTCTEMRQISQANAGTNRRRLLEFNQTSTTTPRDISTTDIYFTTSEALPQGCIKLDIIPDMHTEDISWTLTGLDTNGESTMVTAISGVGVPDPPCYNNTNNDTCFEFTISDAFGDGLSYGMGTWNIEWYGQEWSSVTNGQYGSNETFAFCNKSVYQNEEAAVVDIVVSIIDEISLNFMIAFIDNIVPMFENRIEANLIFSEIGNRDLNSGYYSSWNLEEDDAEGNQIPLGETKCISDGNQLVYCSSNGIESIIDALAVLCIFDSENQTLLQDFEYYWGEVNENFTFVANESASFAFIDNSCPSITLEYDEDEDMYTLSSGQELLNQSFLLFDANYNTESTAINPNFDSINAGDSMDVPQIYDTYISSTESWIDAWDVNIENVCVFYDINPEVIETICTNAAFNINIKPVICQYESCQSQACTADEIVIVYTSESKKFYKEDLLSFSVPYETGPNKYEITDLEFVPLGQLSLDTKCFDDYNVSEGEVHNKGVLVLSNSSCDHTAIIVKLQSAGARAVIIGEDMAIPQTDAPTFEPTAAPTITQVDSLWIFINATLNGVQYVNISQFNETLHSLTAIMKDAFSVPVEIPQYIPQINTNDTVKMTVKLDATVGNELWASLRQPDSVEMYLQLLQWSMEFELTEQVNDGAQFQFLPEEIDFRTVAPTPKPTPEVTSMPTTAPTVQEVYIPVRKLKGSSGRIFAKAVSIWNYTNPDPYPYPESTEIIAGINDLYTSFMCDPLLPTSQPTAAPTDGNENGTEYKTKISDEISIYGFSSGSSTSNPQWIVSLSEYLYNSSCLFVDVKNDKNDVNDTSNCKPRLESLYKKCLMTVTESADGTIIQTRNGQIETLISPVDKLCIYRNIDDSPGFLEPLDDSTSINLESNKQHTFPLTLQDIAKNSTVSCEEQSARISLTAFETGTYCFFIDAEDGDSVWDYTLKIKRVYAWSDPFMQIHNSVFKWNRARGNGGAIAIDSESGTVGDYSSIRISETEFTDNNASEGIGGAIYKASGMADNTVNNFLSVLLIENENIDDYINKGNTAGYGGGSVGIEGQYSTNIWRTVVRINKVIFDSNSAINFGGALYSYWGNIYITDTEFKSNSVIKSGGAIYLVSSGFATFDTKFRFNRAINESAELDKKKIRYSYDNDGGAIFYSFYDPTYDNPACFGVYSVTFENNTAGNTGGAMWLGLYGDEAKFGLSCVQLSAVNFIESQVSQGNKAEDGGRSVFLNVSNGTHPILFGETQVTKLCEAQSNICKQFESTVYHMCIQVYEIAGGVCNVNITKKIEEDAVGWVSKIQNVSLAYRKTEPNATIEMFPGASEMFQVFGWDVYGNRLFPNEFAIDLSTEADGIDLTETIQSPVFDSWLFPLFTTASEIGTLSEGKIFDINGVAADLTIMIEIVTCSDGYEYLRLGENITGQPTIFTCTPCAAGSYIMNSNNCTNCDLGLECLGTNHVKIDQYWYGKPQTDGLMALQLCPPGVCCSEIDGCDWKYNKGSLCALNRDHEQPLCGACLPGFTETSSASGACGECGPYSSLIFLLPGLAGFLLVLFYLKRLSKAKQDIPHPLVAYITRSALFVFQLLPILTFQSSSAVFQPLGAITNFEIDFSSTTKDSAGTCYLQEMGPRDKIGIGLIPSFIFLGQLLVLYVLYKVKIKFKPSKKWTPTDTKKWNLSFYMTFWQLALMLYAKVTASLLKLTDCRSVGEFGTRMWYAGSIKCWDPYHGVAWFFLAVMFVLPFVIVYILKREYSHIRHNGDTGKGWKHLRKKYPALVMPYRRQRYWYSAWNLARRFLLIGIASIPTSRPDYSATALAVVVGFVLGIHVFSRPFYHEINNKLETFCLFCAFGLSILNIMLNPPVFYSTITAVLAFAPLFPVPFLMYQWLSDKSPVTLKITNDAYLDEGNLLASTMTPAFMSNDYDYNNKSKRKLQQLQTIKTTRVQKKQANAAWKSIRIPGRNLHLIKKIDLVDEVGTDAKSSRRKPRLDYKNSGSTTGDVSDSQFYPSDDSRGWSRNSQESYTKDEDFINEELDERTLWQVLTDKKVEKYESESDEDDSIDKHLMSTTEEDNASDVSSLADNETLIKTHNFDGESGNGNGESESEENDYVNKYYYRKKHDPDGANNISLFGGKFKFKKGLKAQRKILKEQREMIALAKKRKDKEAKQRKRNAKAQGSIMSPRMRTRNKRSTAADAAEAYFDTEMALTDNEGYDGDTQMTVPTRHGMNGSFLGVGGSIELHSMTKQRSMDISDISKQLYEDPFVIEKRDAAIKRKERLEKKRKKALAEAKRKEESDKRTNEQKLDKLWGDTTEMKTAKDISEITASANAYLQKENDSDSSDESDGIPANELLGDNGDAFVMESINLCMGAMLDIAFGNRYNGDNALLEICEIDDSELEIEEINSNNSNNVTPAMEMKDAISLTSLEESSQTNNEATLHNTGLDSDLMNSAEMRAALSKKITPHTKKLMQKFQFESTQFDDEIIMDDAMEMVMELQFDDEDEDDSSDNEVMARNKKGKSKQTMSTIRIEPTQFASGVLDIDDELVLENIESVPL